MTTQTLTIFHNPKCSTSRKVLDAMHASGAQPKVVEYLKTGWTRGVLDGLLAQMKAEPRAILRTREPLAKELHLDRPDVSGEAILQAMIAHPVLVERPIVAGPKGAAVCRPADVVEQLL